MRKSTWGSSDFRGATVVCTVQIRAKVVRFPRDGKVKLVEELDQSIIVLHPRTVQSASSMAPSVSADFSKSNWLNLKVFRKLLQLWADFILELPFPPSRAYSGHARLDG